MTEIVLQNSQAYAQIHLLTLSVHTIILSTQITLKNFNVQMKKITFISGSMDVSNCKSNLIHFYLVHWKMEKFQNQNDMDKGFLLTKMVLWECWTMEGKRHTVFQISRFHISHTRSWHGVIRLIIRVSPFAVPGTSHFLFFSEYLWTIDYRYHIVPALYLVDAHDMSKFSSMHIVIFIQFIRCYRSSRI